MMRAQQISPGAGAYKHNLNNSFRSYIFLVTLRWQFSTTQFSDLPASKRLCLNFLRCRAFVLILVSENIIFTSVRQNRRLGTWVILLILISIAFIVTHFLAISTYFKALFEEKNASLRVLNLKIPLRCLRSILEDSKSYNSAISCLSYEFLISQNYYWFDK